MDRSLRSPSSHSFSPKGLHVYQYKSERNEPRPLKRWKVIPLLTPDMAEAAQLIQKGVFKRPGRRKLDGIVDFMGRQVTYYGGRKDFFPRMRLTHGEAEVSRMMGHKTVDVARKHYDDLTDAAPGL